MSKKERREQRRAERRRQQIIWIGVGSVLLIALAAFVIANVNANTIPGDTVIPGEGRGHVPDGTPIVYQHYPPSSGQHHPVPAPWGVTTDLVPDEVFVHNLEHGGVVFLYTCPETCPELEKQFRDLYAKAPPDSVFKEVKILISRYTRPLPTLIVALAWNHQVNLDKFDEALLLRWYNRYVNQGPELAP